MPRRTRSSTQTTAIRPPLKRVAPTEETPTMPLTPVEVDSLVLGAQAAHPLSEDASTRPTVEAFRPALGSSPIPTVVGKRLDRPAAPPSAARSAPTVRATPPPAPATPSPAPATPSPALPTPATTASSPATAESAAPVRGPRRIRETLRAALIRPPSRKR